MKGPKIIFGIVAALSLAACGKGSKVTKERFFEEVEKIEDKKDNFKKAKLTYKAVKKSGYDSDIETENKTYSGIYVKDEDGEWESGSESNDSDADYMFMVYAAYLNFNYSRNSGFGTTSSKGEEKYYIKPFSYECYYKEENDYTSIEDDTYLKELKMYSTVVDSTKKYSYTIQYRYKWNDYGYLTTLESKSEMKTEYSNKTKYTEIQNSTVKITYK